MGLLTGISVFSGLGGIDLALSHRVRTVCYVELDKYCQQVLQARIRDGHLEPGPIWDDVRTFNGKPWRGRVDIVFGGVPCQDVSIAGKRAGLQEGNRTGLWYEMARLIGEIRPRYVFIENVPGLITAGLDKVLGSLASLGYDAEWLCLSAAEVGAPHIRKRVFVLGVGQNMQCNGGDDNTRNILCGGTIPKLGDGGRAENMAHSKGGQSDKRERRDVVEKTESRRCSNAASQSSSEEVADALGTGLEGRNVLSECISQRATREGGVADAKFRIFSSDYWQEDPADVSESGVDRLAYGVPHRVDRLKTLGNAVVPRQCRIAFELLAEKAGKE